jgi:hypothetical protein
LAWGIFGLAATIVAAGSVLLVVGFVTDRLSAVAVVGQFALLPPAVSFSVVGLIVALKQPRNACGWLMLAIGAMWSVGVTPPTPQDHWSTWALGWGWVPPFGLMATHLPLRLPDGQLPSPRWRWVSRAATTAIVLTCVGFLFDPNLPDNPLANEGLAVLALVGIAGMGICGILSIASTGRALATGGTGGATPDPMDRDRRDGLRRLVGGDPRRLVDRDVSVGGARPDPQHARPRAVLAIPVSIGIAILKYRLFDIDVVIRKALVGAILAAFFVTVYALVVGGVGALAGNTSSTVLSFAAAVVAAVAFNPSSRVLDGSPTGSCTGSVRRRTRCSRGSEITSPRPTPPTRCCLGRRGCWPRASGQTGRGCGWRITVTSARSPPGRTTPIPSASTIIGWRCVIRATCSAPCRSRCRRAIRWTRRRRS